ncbi:hypothetical protein [Streptomyces alanosinicus]|uniref:Uncharacterized protein n=1 Tax=Streptomyces alanosinicus TaxID=68171 RepID=A0A918YP70_9ACTN|nr:hypothetical protein [Streptomyces alanosinicus]GHE11441.1 hypothetical protein GCM10010339_71320 [Streptomyces alanosinicus]
MTPSAHATGHTPASSALISPDREQSTPMLGVGTEFVLTEIARLANELCEHLTDSQWLTAARIRELAESTLPNVGDR